MVRTGPAAAAGAGRVVVGAGLAGSAVAAALARRGCAVEVLDAAARPAAGASGNPLGVVHLRPSAYDGLRARFDQQAYLADARRVGRGAGRLALPAACCSSPATRARARPCVPPRPCGRRAGRGGWSRTRPPASRAWRWPTAASICRRPAPWNRPPGAALRLDRPGVRLRLGCRVAALAPRPGGGWRLLDAAGRTLAEAPVVVLATARRGPNPAARDRRERQSRADQRAGRRGALAGAAGGAQLWRLFEPRGRRPALARRDRPAWATRMCACARKTTPRTWRRSPPWFRRWRRNSPRQPLLDDPARRCAARGRTGCPWSGRVLDPAAVACAYAPLAKGQRRRDWPPAPERTGLYVCVGFGAKGLTGTVPAAELIAAYLFGGAFRLARNAAPGLAPGARVDSGDQAGALAPRPHWALKGLSFGFSRLGLMSPRSDRSGLASSSRTASVPANRSSSGHRQPVQFGGPCCPGSAGAAARAGSCLRCLPRPKPSRSNR
ncbi:MAG: hypothetical protein KatS3mg121_0727 [Gammaproteobacteria bacterium]|nr:MAG: hypothetical protein KatS3mg121_0727 [Gammaproteobacteria bacterium]